MNLIFAGEEEEAGKTATILVLKERHDSFACRDYDKERQGACDYRDRGRNRPTEGGERQRAGGDGTQPSEVKRQQRRGGEGGSVRADADEGNEE